MNRHQVTFADGSTDTRNSKARRYTHALIATVTERMWLVEARQQDMEAACFARLTADHAATVARFDAGTETTWDTREGQTRADHAGYLARSEQVHAEAIAAAAAHRAHTTDIKLGAQGVMSWHMSAGAAAKALSNRRQDNPGHDFHLVDLDADGEGVA